MVVSFTTRPFWARTEWAGPRLRAMVVLYPHLQQARSERTSSSPVAGSMGSCTLTKRIKGSRSVNGLPQPDGFRECSGDAVGTLCRARPLASMRCEVQKVGRTRGGVSGGSERGVGEPANLMGQSARLDLARGGPQPVQ